MSLRKSLMIAWILHFSVAALVMSLPVRPSNNRNRNPEEIGGYYQGDMILAPRTNARGVALRYPYATKWPGGIIPYQFENISANHTPLIIQTMREMENLTAVNNTPCIRFREKTPSDSIFITIFNGSGCYATVGSWGNYTGLRPVSLMDSPDGTCMVPGIIQHELNHVLGFLHEQSRPDRDKYVSILWNNIEPGMEFNFDKYNETFVDTLMTPYDHDSVMHYSSDAFTVNFSLPTIIPIFNSSAHLGQRARLSPIDVLEIQRFYGCLPTPTTSTTTTRVPTATGKATTPWIGFRLQCCMYSLGLIIVTSIFN